MHNVDIPPPPRTPSCTSRQQGRYSTSLVHIDPLDDVQRNGLIYLTRWQVAQRSLARSLKLIRLKRKLSNRPSIPSLIERGVLPMSYYRKSEDDAALWEPVGIAPALLVTARELERERIKDKLRGWVGGERLSLADAERVGWVESLEEGSPRVRDIATRFTRQSNGETRGRFHAGLKVEF